MKDYIKKSVIQLIMVLGYLIGISIALAGVVTMFKDDKVNSSLTIASLIFFVIGFIFLILLVKLIKPNLYVWFKYTPVPRLSKNSSNGRVRSKLY